MVKNPERVALHLEMISSLFSQQRGDFLQNLIRCDKIPAEEIFAAGYFQTGAAGKTGRNYPVFGLIRTVTAPVSWSKEDHRRTAAGAGQVNGAGVVGDKERGLGKKRG